MRLGAVWTEGLLGYSRFEDPTKIFPKPFQNSSKILSTPLQNPAEILPKLTLGALLGSLSPLLGPRGAKRPSRTKKPEF